MIWPAEDIWQSCVPLLPALTVEVLKEVDSTNSELMRRARAGQTDPVFLVAESQTAGRGRLGRQWHAQAGASLTFSLGLRLHPADWSGLSLALGLSVANSLDPHGELGLGLKWPNDLWVTCAWPEPAPQGVSNGQEREKQQALARLDTRSYWAKLGGILIETAALPNVESFTSPQQDTTMDRYCVVGVGVNIVAPHTHDFSTPAVGLSELPNRTHRANAPDQQHLVTTAPHALAAIAQPLLAAVLAFQAQGFAPLQAAFHSRDVLRNHAVTLSDGRHGVARGVDNAGVLLVDTDQGLQRISSAEVSVRLR